MARRSALADETATAASTCEDNDSLVCPVARTASIVSGKWTLLIIRDLTTGTKRFSESGALARWHQPQDTLRAPLRARRRRHPTAQDLRRGAARKWNTR